MTNIKLSDRLQTIADMVKKGSRIIDVGCDHAFLDIYLVKNNIVKKAIASDITKGAINQAIKNVNDYIKIKDKIKKRKIYLSINSFLKVSMSASTSVGFVQASIAVFGSLSKCPVTTQVIVSPLSTTP